MRVWPWSALLLGRQRGRSGWCRGQIRDASDHRSLNSAIWSGPSRLCPLSGRPGLSVDGFVREGQLFRTRSMTITGLSSAGCRRPSADASAYCERSRCRDRAARPDPLVGHGRTQRRWSGLHTLTLRYGSPLVIQPFYVLPPVFALPLGTRCARHRPPGWRPRLPRYRQSPMQSEGHCYGAAQASGTAGDPRSGNHTPTAPSPSVSPCSSAETKEDRT